MTRQRPPDIIELGVGELVFLAGALVGMGTGLAIAENFREWLLRGLHADGFAGYALELVVTTFATVLGGLWAGILALATTVVLARVLAWYYRRKQPSEATV